MKMLLGFISLLIAGIPTWLWLGFNHFAQPQGFWQKFALMGAGIWFLGGVQLTLAICWLFF
jgi:hypothetical protein